jgi:glycosyltransferase involved in cell wall biosynthesis
VLPSLAEGVSNTILEAMACGLPVIASRVGANANLVAEDATGCIVRAADSEALARAMLAYFEAPARAQAHGRAGRARVEQRFSLDRMVDRYHDLYQGALSKQPFGMVAAAPADRTPPA